MDPTTAFVLAAAIASGAVVGIVGGVVVAGIVVTGLRALGGAIG